MIGVIKRKIFGMDISNEEYRRRGIRIGENVHIIRSELDYGYGFLIEIGNNVTLTHTTILTHDASTKMVLDYTKVGKVVIGDNVFVGYGSIILPGVHIGSNVIIGAGAVIREDIPDNSVAVGNPGIVICSMDEYIDKNRKRLETCPVFDTYWKEKTSLEKDQMIRELESTIGYNP